MTRDRDLARRVHEALGALPVPRAPGTLLPRILAALERPWYARTWLTWPVLLQAASVVVLLAVVGGAGWVVMAAEDASSLGSVARVAWRWVVAPLAAYLFVTAVALSVVVAASWAALSRVALGGLTE